LIVIVLSDALFDFWPLVHANFVQRKKM